MSATDTLTASGVTIQFAGLVALDHVDLEIRPRTILGLIGPNGAGKTTFINGITGFERLTSGSVRLGDRQITGLPAHKLAALGIVRTFQSGHSFGRLTTVENVDAAVASGVLRRSAARKRARQLLEFVQLAHRAEVAAKALPHGDERRLELARALALGPRFLFLDEPAAGLNESESDELIEIIHRARDEMGCGIVLIEHDMRVVMKICDQIQVLDHGRTIAIGTPAEIRNNPAVIEAYLGQSRNTRQRSPSQRLVPTTRLDPMLEVEGLVVRYGAVTALQDVSIRVEEGELVGVIGANGAGKTTLLSAIMGLVAPAQGRISFLGRSIIGQRPEKIARKRIGLVPEGRHIFASLTVKENLRLGLTTRQSKSSSADFEDLYARFPILRSYSDAAARRLSGGEQQQLAIARALIAQPRLLLLDEPSLGLAPLAVDLIFSLLNELRRDGVTILLVEQNARRTIEMADRTYVLKLGRLALAGTRDDLVSMSPTDLANAYLGVM